MPPSLLASDHDGGWVPTSPRPVFAVVATARYSA